jgi:hypothetical protein
MDYDTIHNINKIARYGSIYLALENNFITNEDILEWLNVTKISKLTLSIYKVLSQRIHPNIQYLKNNIHFLVENCGYFLSATRNILNVKSPSVKNCNDVTLNDHFGNPTNSSKLIKENFHQKKFISFLYSGKYIDVDFCNKNLKYTFQSRLYPNFDMTQDSVDNLLSTDWLDKIQPCSCTINKILDRVKLLKIELPDYYTKVVKKDYRILATKFEEKNCLTELSKDKLLEFVIYFPGILHDNIIELPEISQRIMLYGEIISGYLLGFPVNIITPSNDQLLEACNLLTTIGSYEYVKLLKVKNKDCYLSLSLLNEETHYANETDVMLNDIEDYSPFDVVPYLKNKHLYRFSRIEFDKILENLKNPWTNEELPSNILYEISKRNQLSKELSLPECNRLIDNFIQLNIY